MGGLLGKTIEIALLRSGVESIWNCGLKTMIGEAKLVKCNSCGDEFYPSGKFQMMMAKFIDQGHGLIMMECPKCYADIAWKPVEKKKGVPYRCPVSHCGGWVSYVENFDDGKFWGCGECGATWRSNEGLMRDISSIQEKYEYRKTCYIKEAGSWAPGDLNNEVEGYEELVESEEYDEKNDFDRG